MARSPAEVQADIALTRQGIERTLDALHDRLPKRWWLSYAWLAGGVTLGVLLSRAPLFTVVGRGLRLIEFASAVMGAAAMVERALSRPRREARAMSDGYRTPTYRVDEVRS